MPDVQFQEELSAPVSASQPSFLTRFAYATGLAKNEQEAQYVLIAIAIICVVIAIALPVFFLSSEPTAVPAPYVPQGPVSR